MKTTLFKRDKKGKLLQWSIEHDDKSYWTESGQVGGKLTATLPTFVEQKYVGKSNETSLEQQVQNEVASKIQKQLDLGYTYEEPGEESRFEVSLAHKYQDRLEKNKLEFPYIVEPKLDGIRCYIKKVGSEIKMFSRKHKEFVSCPHIKENKFVREFFYRHPDAILDGELYNHELKDDFNKIVSLVKKTKLKQEDLKASAELVQYHCFDVYYADTPALSYRNRKICLACFLHDTFGVGKDGFLQENVHIDEVYFVGLSFSVSEEGTSWYIATKNAVTEDDAEELIAKYVAQGYEGIMLKRSVPYFFGRSFDMLKYKKFSDKEYRIVDFEEGKGNLAGIAAAVICETEDGQQFKAGVAGTQEYAAELFANRAAYVGSWATIKYQALTPAKDGKGGVPRFGKMFEIRNYE